jgi:hypothetical protein
MSWKLSEHVSKLSGISVSRHPFDSSKWGRIERFLVEDGLLDHKRVVEPVEATKEDLLVVICYHYCISVSCHGNHGSHWPRFENYG